MFEIGAGTYSALKAVFNSSAFTRLIDFVESYYPAIAVRHFDSGLEAPVRTLVQQAEQLGFVSVEGVFGFVDLACLCGAGFPRRPEDAWALPTLTDLRRSEVQRIAACHQGIARSGRSDASPPPVQRRRPRPFLPELDD